MRFPNDVILNCIHWYLTYPLSYRHIAEKMEVRGMSLDHSSINRRTIRFLHLIEKLVHRHKCLIGSSWRMVETYVKVKAV